MRKEKTMRKLKTERTYEANDLADALLRMDEDPDGHEVVLFETIEDETGMDRDEITALARLVPGRIKVCSNGLHVRL